MTISSTSLQDAKQFFENEDYVRAGYLTVKNRGNAIKPCDESTLQNIARHFYDSYGYQTFLLTYGNMTRFILYTDKLNPPEKQPVPINKIMRDGLEKDSIFSVFIHHHLTEGDGLSDITDGDNDNFFSSTWLKKCKRLELALKATLINIAGKFAPFGIIRNAKFSRLEEIESILPMHGYQESARLIPLFGEDDLEYIIVAANRPGLIQCHKEYYDQVLGIINSVDDLHLIRHGVNCERYCDDIVQFKAEGGCFWFNEMFYRSYFENHFHFTLKSPRYFQCYPPELFYKIEVSWGASEWFKGVRAIAMTEFINAHLGLLGIIPARDMWIVFQYGRSSFELVIRPSNWNLDTPAKRAEFEAVVSRVTTTPKLLPGDVITKSFVDEE